MSRPARSGTRRPGTGRGGTGRSGTEQRRRSGLVAFRLLPADRARLDRVAGARAMTAGDLARAAALREIWTDAADSHDIDVHDVADAVARPRVVTLCGSMRFLDRMLVVAAELTRAGEIVLAPFEVVPAAAQNARAGEKERLDWLHRRKIDLSDAVVVVSDASGYYGASTRAEIAYATAQGLPVTYRQVSDGSHDSPDGPRQRRELGRPDRHEDGGGGR